MSLVGSYMPLITIIFIRVALARDLRPSDHGLEYQNPPPSKAKSSPQMTSFFKGSSSPSTSSNFALPRESNSTDTSWWTARRGSGKGDHVRHVMLVSSLVCGVTGVVLLIASAFIYFFRFQNRNSSPSSSSSCLNNNNNRNRK